MPTQSHPILSPASAVVTRANHVQISAEAITALVATLLEENVRPAHWLKSAPTAVQDYLNALSYDDAAMFLLIFHSAGFSYWGEPAWAIKDIDGTTYNGSAAWLICLIREPRLLKPAFVAALTQANWEAISVGESGIKMPLSAQRLEILQNTGRLLVQANENQNLFNLEGDALECAFRLAAILPGFADIASYGADALRLPFLKRSQLLLNDWNYLRRQNALPGFSNIGNLTAFADYKIPQLLRHLSILKYSMALSTKIDSKIELTADAEEEIEIRAATIVAVERIREQLDDRGHNMTAAEIDNFLWSAAQKNLPGQTHTQMRPYHRCRTSNY